MRFKFALNCKINNESSFDRKNYFYPDTPKNYQITQFDNSYAGKGYLEFKLNSGRMVKVGITKLQIEEDAAKSIHANSLLLGSGKANHIRIATSA